jgi:hypothetical protein
LFILVAARKGATSYMSHLENLPNRIEKQFADNSRFVIYPKQFTDSISIEAYEDISTEPLNKGLEAVHKIGKEIGSLFKKKEGE